MKGDDYQERRKQQECRSSSEGEGSTKRPKNASSTDGASIKVARRRRGRPLGSKNKPKPPMIITREITDSSMRPHILHVLAGHDVVDAIARFARRLNTGLCILTGTGTVANVMLRHPTTNTSSVVTFHGRFEILSISAIFLPSSSSSPFSSWPFLSNEFKILIAGAQGQIVGGSVVGSLMAAGTVVVVATVLSNPSFHRLNGGEDEIFVSGSDTIAHHHQQERQQEEQHQDDHKNHGMDCISSGGMSVFSLNLPSSVIWAPLARPPPPY